MSIKKIEYRPVRGEKKYYLERTDRNIGWILPEEQKYLRSAIIGIAGTGGMGGVLSSILLRAGFGELRIADREQFDYSNINRQFAARRASVGKNKALETAKELRRITDDSKIIAYPQGITEETVGDFVAGTTLIFDEVDLFSLSARILLHQYARTNKIPIISCSTVGFGTRLFLFTPNGTTVEDLLGLSYERACSLENELFNGSRIAHYEIMKLALKLVPELPVYREEEKASIVNHLKNRRAPVIASNPSLAAGFAANQAILFLLQNTGLNKRNIIKIPIAPGYLYFDSALMSSKIVVRGNKND